MMKIPFLASHLMYKYFLVVKEFLKYNVKNTTFIFEFLKVPQINPLKTVQKRTAHKS